MNAQRVCLDVVSGFSRTAAVFVLAVACAAGAACGGGSDTPAPGGAVPAPQPAPAAQPGDAAAPGLDIQYRNEPDPPHLGPNTIEVTVRQPDGSPITDATVATVFTMPAMPAMNMPAMRSDAPLTHAGGGVYRGTGQLSMAGTWTVNVTVSRGSAPLGSKRFSVVAK